MSAATCDLCRSVAPELALGIAVGDDRADAFAHLSDCASCRRELDDLTRTLDALLSVAPALDPPDGFAERAMDTFGGSSETATGTRRATRRRSMRLALAAAAAAVVAVVVLGGVGALTVSMLDEDTPTRSSETAEAPTAAMHGVLTTAEGTEVGAVTLEAAAPSGDGRDGSTELVVVLAPNAPPDTYRVECDYESGHPYTAGELRVAAGGVDRWSAPVSVPTYDLRRVRLVSTSGGPNLEAEMTA